MSLSLLCCLCPPLATAETPPHSNPFSPESLQADRQQAWRKPPTLHFFEPAQLKLVGTLTSGTQRHAILQDPLLHVHLVSLGARIGQQDWRISQIDERTVLLTTADDNTSRAARTQRLQMESP